MYPYNKNIMHSIHNCVPLVPKMCIIHSEYPQGYDRQCPARAGTRSVLLAFLWQNRPGRMDSVPPPCWPPFAPLPSPITDLLIIAKKALKF